LLDQDHFWILHGPWAGAPIYPILLGLLQVEAIVVHLLEFFPTGGYRTIFARLNALELTIERRGSV